MEYPLRFLLEKFYLMLLEVRASERISFPLVAFVGLSSPLPLASATSQLVALVRQHRTCCGTPIELVRQRPPPIHGDGQRLILRRSLYMHACPKRIDIYTCTQSMLSEKLPSN